MLMSTNSKGKKQFWNSTGREDEIGFLDIKHVEICQWVSSCDLRVLTMTLVGVVLQSSLSICLNI